MTEQLLLIAMCLFIGFLMDVIGHTYISYLKGKKEERKRNRPYGW